MLEFMILLIGMLPIALWIIGNHDRRRKTFKRKKGGVRLVIQLANQPHILRYKIPNHRKK